MKTNLLLFALFVTPLSLAQNYFETLGETGLSVNYQLTNNYRTNFSARTRYYIYQDSDFNLKNRQIDLVHFSTLSLNYNKSVSFGIQYRVREAFDGGSNELRLTQQYNYTKRNMALRFGHRFRFEQRFLNDVTILRFRYRLALDFPLNGEKVDVGEAYMVASSEALLSANNKAKPEIDHRTTAQIGWQISEDLKLQFGLEYRFEAININTEELLFILSTAVLKL